MLLNLRCSSIVCLAGLMLSASVLAQDKPPAPTPSPAPSPAPAVKAPTDLSGHWSGTWCSHSNGHDGPICGDFRKIDENNYCVHFSGKFWGLFPFEYDVMLTVVERKEDSVTMSGSKNLGLLFGTFSYNATVTETTFNASYCSRKDHGVFHMTRVCRP